MDKLLSQYKSWLLLEKSLSPLSVESYFFDLRKLLDFCDTINKKPVEIEMEDLQFFLAELYQGGIHPRSVARILSGIRSFYKFLMMEEYLLSNPTDLIQSPLIGKKLPEVLTVEEINAIIGSVDLSDPLGQRNRAMLELLYSCGLRVSELCSLKIEDVYIDERYIKVTGKGKKQRLVPISRIALREMELYLIDRKKISVQKGSESILFLNRRGQGIKRIMVFHIIKTQTALTGIQKNVSPHTFRHSFATHLYEGGANLRAIQQMLGHESIITTEIYTHIDTSMLRSEILRFHPRNQR